MPAILFGSLSTLADTSELQRRAFNQAFADHGLGWEWDREQYRAMLDASGGAARIEEFARSRGETVDAAAVHATKSAIFQRDLAASGVGPRAGVLETIRGAKDGGVRLGFVTTTSPANVAALFDALAPDVTAADFDVVVDADAVGEPKPDPAAYRYALERLGEDAGACVAIEDNAGGVRAAAAAGVACVAFPNENTAGHDLDGAQRSVEHLELDDLRRSITVR